MARGTNDQATQRLRDAGGRDKVAAELWMRLKRGPQFSLDETLTPAEVRARYRGWINSWILDDLARLVPELRGKLGSLGYVDDDERA